jgi:hypothetical protein
VYQFGDGVERCRVVAARRKDSFAEYFAAGAVEPDRLDLRAAKVNADPQMRSAV